MKPRTPRRRLLWLALLAGAAGCARVIDVDKQIEILRTGDQKERQEAQAKLVQAGLSAIEPLKKELERPDSAIKKSVVRILGLIGERDRKEDILLTQARNAAVEALIKVALTDDRRHIGPKDDPAYLKDIAKALGSYDDPRCAEPLMMMYAEIEDSAVRGQVKASLKALGWRAAAAIDRYRKKAEPGSLLDKGVKEIIAQLSDKLSRQVQQTKRGGFLMLGKDEEWEEVRVEAAKALALLGITKPKHIQRLLKTIASPGENPEMRAALCKAVGDRPVRDIRRPQNRDALREAMKDENALVAVYAARALAKAGDLEAVSRLLNLTKSGYVEQLEGLSEEELAKKQRTYERDERVKSNQVRILAAEALGDVGGAVVDELTNNLFNENKNVRWAAVDALGRIGGEVAMGALISELVSKDELADITVMAALWLGKNGDRRAIRPLMGMLQDHDERVRSIAKWALQQLAENPKTADAALYNLNAALRRSVQEEEAGSDVAGDTIKFITDEAYRLQRELGAGLAASIYKTAFAARLRAAKPEGLKQWSVKPAPPLDVKLDGRVLGRVAADLIVNDIVVVDIQCVGQLTAAHDAALRAYLDRLPRAQTAGRIGLLLNFMRDPLESRRVTRATAQLAEANLYRVAEVLTVVGDASSVEPLCRVIADPVRDAKLRQTAMDAILSITGRLKDLSSRRSAILHALQAALLSRPADEDASDEEIAQHAAVRAHAAKTLAALKWSEGVPLLQNALKQEKDEDAQKATQDALVSLTGKS